METETIMKIANHEYYVSLEVAKLLKEAGFNWEIMSFYTNDITEGCKSEYELRLVKFDNWNIVFKSTFASASSWIPYDGSVGAYFSEVGIPEIPEYGYGQIYALDIETL